MMIMALSASCAKSGVIYDMQESISIKPLTTNMTKAAVGTTPTGQELVIYANYTEGQTPGTVFFDKAVFEEDTPGIWTGKAQEYYWPKIGLLTFAGHTNLPAEYGNVEYSYVDNTISVLDYKQSLNPAETIDFLWFNQTEATNNHLTGKANLEPLFNHALTWITVQGIGKEDSIGWQIRRLTLKGIKDKGSLTCTAGGPVWKNVTETSTDQFFHIYKETDPTKYYALQEKATPIESTARGTVLIPQEPLMLEIEYLNGTIWETIDVDLKISDDSTKNFWNAGKHYVYNLTFNPYKISFSVSINKIDDVFVSF